MAFSWPQQPGNPTFVVEGVNSTRVSLFWTFVLDYIMSLSILRSLPDQNQVAVIASRTPNGAFSLMRGFVKQMLKLFNGPLVRKHLRMSQFSISKWNFFGGKLVVTTSLIDDFMAVNVVGLSHSYLIGCYSSLLRWLS